MAWRALYLYAAAVRNSSLREPISFDRTQANERPVVLASHAAVVSRAVLSDRFSTLRLAMARVGGTSEIPELAFSKTLASAG